MNATIDQPETRADRECREDQEEIARRIERGIDDAKAAISETWAESKIAGERLIRRGRYAAEDSLSELTRTIKRYPVQSLGIAFAVGAVFALVCSSAANGSEPNEG